MYSAKHKFIRILLCLSIALGFFFTPNAVARAASAPEITAQDALSFELYDHIAKATEALAQDLSGAEAGSDLDWLTFIQVRNGNDAGVDHWYEKTAPYLDQKLAADGCLDPVKVTEAQRTLLIANAADLGTARYMDLPITQLTDEGLICSDRDIAAQGENGRIFGVLVGSAIGDCEVRDAIKQQAEILIKQQNSDGSFSLKAGGSGDYDITAMALQAFTQYAVSSGQDLPNDAIKAAGKAATWLKQQEPTSSENLAQRIIGFTALKHLSDNHPDLEIPEIALWDTVLADYEALANHRDGLYFKHELDDESTGNRTATIQGLLAETALLRYLNDANDLYDLSDVYDRTPDFSTAAASNHEQISATLQAINDEAKRFLPWDKPNADEDTVKAWLDKVDRLPERLRTYVPAYEELSEHTANRTQAWHFIVIGIVVLILVNIAIFLFRSHRVKQNKAEEEERLRRATFDEHHHILLIGIVALSLSLAVSSCNVFQTKDDYYQATNKSGTQSVTACIDARLAVQSDELDAAIKPGEDFPANGIILAPTEFSFKDGETALELLNDIARAEKLIVDVQGVGDGGYSSGYVKGISHLYEFSAGPLSGWMFRVNGELPQKGISQYKLQAGDQIEYVYSLDAGDDVGSEGFESLMP